MIEIARAFEPFERADDVLASDTHWVVVERSSGKHLIACRIRRVRETMGETRKDDVLTVRVDADRRYLDIAWIKQGGSLLHKGRWTVSSLGPDSRPWRIVLRLWGHLVEGRIPNSVEIWPDEAFERDRLRTFQEAHPDVWRELITQSGFKRFNEDKLALVRRFGRLTEAELESIRRRKRKQVPGG